jgi:hypothetical protein
MSNQKWLVIHRRYGQGRIGSVPLNDHNLNIVKTLFGALLIQKDTIGHEHWVEQRTPTMKEIKGQEFDKTLDATVT